ncbi:MAG: hypothetical protein SF066_20315, partial [Thermoanaerobaculia bacterium]|nr:hypothetical protein [Thermoanaerobaculia bacterium]
MHPPRHLPLTRGLLAAALMTGCHPCSSPAANVMTPDAAVTSPEAAPVVSPPLPLGDKLAYEATHRPSLQVNADGVFSAFEDAGVVFGRRFQSVAAVYQASYCTNGSVDAGLDLTVCEYPTPQAAANARERLVLLLRKVE